MQRVRVAGVEVEVRGAGAEQAVGELHSGVGEPAGPGQVPVLRGATGVEVGHLVELSREPAPAAGALRGIAALALPSVTDIALLRPRSLADGDALEVTERPRGAADQVGRVDRRRRRVRVPDVVSAVVERGLLAVLVHRAGVDRVLDLLDGDRWVRGAVVRDQSRRALPEQDSGRAPWRPR